MTKAKSFISLVLLTAWTVSVSEAAPDPETSAELERLLNLAGVPAISIAIIEEGQLAWADGMGERGKENSSVVDSETVFEAASLTKPIVAVAALRLVERREFSLDWPLFEIYPYPDLAHDVRAEQLTARMVLSHTTGLPNWRPRGESLEFQYEPSERFRYSGEGFVYLARVLEEQSGMPLPELVRREVFDPLGMSRSSLIWQASFEENHAVGHTEDGESIEKQRPTEANAAASLHTTAGDYGKFLVALLNGRLLGKELTAEMLTPQVELEPGLHWGLGVGLEDQTQGSALWQWGDNWGYKGFVWLQPDAGHGFVFFANSNNGSLLFRDLVARFAAPDQTSLRWLDYESYDDPSRVIRTQLVQSFEDDGLAGGSSTFQELRKEYPPDAFPESLLNRLGYKYLQENTHWAIAIFEWNVELYPEAANTYDSLGEGYMTAGDTKRAIQSYERSLALDPDNTNAVQMLERLRDEE